MIIDTHCHLDFAEFSADIDAVLDRARISGVTHVINVASNVSGCRGGLALASEKDNVYCTLGVHPHHASETSPEELDGVEGLYAPGKR
jgi:TatD DNase family protein